MTIGIAKIGICLSTDNFVSDHESLCNEEYPQVCDQIYCLTFFATTFDHDTCTFFASVMSIDARGKKLEAQNVLISSSIIYACGWASAFSLGTTSPARFAQLKSC